MAKLTDDQYWAYRKAHACPIPKEDLEAQMFIGDAGSSENTQGDRNTPDTFIGTECGDKEPEPVIGTSCPDDDLVHWVGESAGKCLEPSCKPLIAGLGKNAKYKKDAKSNEGFTGNELKEIANKSVNKPLAGYECGHCSKHTTVRVGNEPPYKLY